MQKPDLVIIAILLAAVVIVVGLSIWLPGSKGQEEEKQSLAQNTTDVPKLEIDQKEFTITPGVVVKQRDIWFKNTGSGSLILSKPKLSPGIDVFYLAANDDLGKQLKEDLDFEAILEKDKEIMIRVTFKKDFDWLKPTDQWLTFKTNDPAQSEARISFTSTTGAE